MHAVNHRNFATVADYQAHVDRVNAEKAVKPFRADTIEPTAPSPQVDVATYHDHIAASASLSLVDGIYDSHSAISWRTEAEAVLEERGISVRQSDGTLRPVSEVVAEVTGVVR